METMKFKKLYLNYKMSRTTISKSKRILKKNKSSGLRLRISSSKTRRKKKSWRKIII